MTAPQTIADTLYYASGANIAALAVDQSQYLDNQVAGATWTYEASPATRYDVDAPWTIEARCEVSTATTGRICSNSIMSLRVGNSPGVVDAILVTTSGTAVVATLTLPSASGSLQDYAIAWAVRPNPDTTGATDVLISELRAWRVGTSDYSQVVTTHADRSAGAGNAWIWWAINILGGNPFTGTPLACRISAAYHTATESYEAMVTASAAPTLVGEARHEITVPPRSTGIGDDGYFAGPIHARAAAACRVNDLRQAGPMGTVERSRITHRGDRVGDEAEVQLDPDMTSSYLYSHWLRWLPVPPGANRLRVRAFIQQWRASGDADQVRTTVLSMSQPGWTHKPPTSPATMQAYRDTVVRVSNDTSGATSGAWITFDPIRIARDNDGCTYVGLAFRVADAGGSGSTADQLWAIKALEIDPIFVDTDDQQPGLGG